MFFGLNINNNFNIDINIIFKIAINLCITFNCLVAILDECVFSIKLCLKKEVILGHLYTAHFIYLIIENQGRDL